MNNHRTGHGAMVVSIPFELSFSYWIGTVVVESLKTIWEGRPRASWDLFQLALWRANKMKSYGSQFLKGISGSGGLSRKVQKIGGSQWRVRMLQTSHLFAAYKVHGSVFPRLDGPPLRRVFQSTFDISADTGCNFPIELQARGFGNKVHSLSCLWSLSGLSVGCLCIGDRL